MGIRYTGGDRLVGEWRRGEGQRWWCGVSVTGIIRALSREMGGLRKQLVAHTGHGEVICGEVGAALHIYSSFGSFLGCRQGARGQLHMLSRFLKNVNISGKYQQRFA
jgi:hypothetical protein